MALPKPLGPYNVSMGDLQLSSYCEGDVDIPLVRFYYPTSAKNSSNYDNYSSTRWLPHFVYARGYVCKIIAPNSCIRRFLISIIAVLFYVYIWINTRIKAFVASQLLIIQGQNDKLPVVVFSHGMWACRTSYSALCCDLASHGYVVVALEHLDGSATVTSYIDKKGKRQWLKHKFSHLKVVPVEERTQQLDQRVAEVRKVADVLESLNLGLIAQTANTVTNKTRLDVKILKGRLDLCHLAVSGHSFGGLTALVTAGLDSRFLCCLALDAWLRPMKEENYEQHAGNVPVLLLNTEAFEWKALRECRMKFLSKREKNSIDGSSLVTELITIKGTKHQDQSDVTLILPTIMKLMGLAGSLDPMLGKDINSRICLSFLYKYLLPPGTGKPYAVDKVTQDDEHLLVS